MQVKKEQLEPDMEQRTGFKIGKGVWQSCILSPCLFNLYAEYIMWNARLDESQAGIKTAGRNIQQLQIYRWYHSDDRTWRETKEPLDEGEKGEWKSWLEIQHSKKIMASVPIVSWQTEEKWKQWQTLSSWFPKSLQMVTAAMKLRDACFLEEKLWETKTAF